MNLVDEVFWKQCPAENLNLDRCEIIASCEECEQIFRIGWEACGKWFHEHHTIVDLNGIPRDETDFMLISKKQE